jgi:hypothetical protein
MLFFAVVGLLLVVMLVLGACAEEEPAEVTRVVEVEVPGAEVEVTRVTEVEVEVPGPEVEVEVTRIVEVAMEPEVPVVEIPEQTAILAAWEASPHGNTYDLGKGPNTYCSRCHSPQNWDPESTTGPPPNCVTCKFPTDEEVRMAPTMGFVEEEDWVGINCETCHIMEGDQSTGELAWLNVRNDEHEPIGNPNELCEKCHLTSDGVSWTGGTGVTHEIYLGGSAHKNWAGILDDTWRPEYCSDCHDPHTQEPMQCVDCHPSVLTSDDHIKGNNEAHANVNCIACHDASEAEVGPHPDEDMGGVWTTVLSSVDRAGEPTLEAIVSHSVKWNVDCDRCHFAENAYELTEYTADGEIPSDEPAGGPPG